MSRAPLSSQDVVSHSNDCTAFMRRHNAHCSVRQVIRQWSCDEHIKCVAYDTEVLPAGEEGADRGPFAAVLAASGTFQVHCRSRSSGAKTINASP